MNEKQQHEKIKGYRTLNEAEIALMNEGKELSEAVGKYIDKLRANGDTQFVDCDQRWVSIGATNLQQGFMALARGIAKPTTF